MFGSYKHGTGINQASTYCLQEERKHKIILLIMPDVELPATLQRLPRAYHATDPDCYERLTKLLSSREYTAAALLHK